MHQGGLAAQGQANHGALRTEGQALDLHLPQHHNSTEAMVKNYSAKGNIFKNNFWRIFIK